MYKTIGKMSSVYENEGLLVLKKEKDRDKMYILEKRFIHHAGKGLGNGEKQFSKTE